MLLESGRLLLFHVQLNVNSKLESVTLFPSCATTMSHGLLILHWSDIRGEQVSESCCFEIEQQKIGVKMHLTLQIYNKCLKYGSSSMEQYFDTHITNLWQMGGINTAAGWISGSGERPSVTSSGLSSVLTKCIWEAQPPQQQPPPTHTHSLMLCLLNSKWKTHYELSFSVRRLLLSLLSEPALDVSVFNSPHLCVFSQSMNKEESMRLFMSTAHWPVGVMERRQLPRHWLLPLMPWKIDGEWNHSLSFQLYHSWRLVTLPSRQVLRDHDA